MPLFSWLKFHSIFWKIFLSFWAAMLLISQVMTFAIGLLWENSRIDEHKKAIRQHKAETALSIYESGGDKALNKWLQKPRHHKQNNFFLADANNNTTDVLGRLLPSKPWANVQLLNGSNNNYKYISINKSNDLSPEQLSPQGWQLPPKIQAIAIFLSIFVTGIISYALAKNITSPIRQLQQATRKISSGNLTVRVSSIIGNRKDELGELSSDFDRMAEQIEELIITQQRMMQDVSHELRSPLTRLQIALELARKVTGKTATIEHDRIENEANRLEDLISQIMSLVRMEHHQKTLHKENISLANMLNQIIIDANFEAKLDDKSVKLTVQTDSCININQALIYSALENIIRNAIKYTSKQTCVNVSLMVEHNMAVIIVTDYGAGVAESALPYLFKPFYRESDARDRASGGYGLGLAIADRAIKLHRGTINATNIEHGGLSITIKLPLTQLYLH